MTDKLCKECRNKFNKIIGEDMGLDSASEYYGLIKNIQICDWIDELCKNWLDSKQVHYLIALYCNGNFEDYFKYSVEWLLCNSGSEDDFEKYLIEKSGRDFREPEKIETPNIFISMIKKINSPIQ